MKTRQRSFVVEYKSGRQRLKQQSHSIWGNTDFKALVLEVRDQSPLFGMCEPTGDVIERAVEHSEQVTQATCQKLADHALPILSDTLEPVARGPGDDYVNLALAPRLQKKSRQPSGENARNRQDRKRPGSEPRDIGDPMLDLDSDVMNNSENDTMQEITALEAENSYLKNLLSAKLRRENSQIVQMLERFKTR